MNLYSQAHLTSSIIMVRPHDFGFNQQTGLDNQFQHKPQEHLSSEITLTALAEFESMVDQLEKFYVEVLVLEKKPVKQPLPDAIFPNNWFSTRSDGKLFIYPMKTPNRKAEVQLNNLTNKLSDYGYLVGETIDLRNEFEPESVLEGTGSLIFHHPSSKVFAAFSERCQAEALDIFCRTYGYKSLSFSSQTQQGLPIYHTNVLMTCGLDFAVIAEETLNSADDKKKVICELSHRVNDIILITEQQMAENFCGNIIQLQDKNAQECIVMSQSAFRGFKSNQIKMLERHGSLVVCKIPTIEHVGGGSARCMIAENFLTKAL